MRQLRYMGQAGTKHEHLVLGYQERLDEMQAAFLRIKLRQMEDQLAGRRRVAARYDAALADPPLQLRPGLRLANLMWSQSFRGRGGAPAAGWPRRDPRDTLERRFVKLAER